MILEQNVGSFMKKYKFKVGSSFLGKVSPYIAFWTFQKCPKAKILKRFVHEKGVLFILEHNEGILKKKKKSFVTEKIFI